jgi:hypothetical protein
MLGKSASVGEVARSEITNMGPNQRYCLWEGEVEDRS